MQLRTGATADEVVAPLCDAFADYPVVRYVLGPEGDYGRGSRSSSATS